MEETDEKYMIKVATKLKQLGIPPTPENKILCMIFNELRELNNNFETLASKLQG